SSDLRLYCRTANEATLRGLSLNGFVGLKVAVAIALVPVAYRFWHRYPQMPTPEQLLSWETFSGALVLATFGVGLWVWNFLAAPYRLHARADADLARISAELAETNRPRLCLTRDVNGTCCSN